MGFSVIRNRLFLTRGDSAEITLIIRDRVTGAIFIPGPDDQLTLPLSESFQMKRQ